MNYFSDEQERYHLELYTIEWAWQQMGCNRRSHQRRKISTSCRKLCPLCGIKISHWIWYDELCSHQLERDAWQLSVGFESKLQSTSCSLPWWLRGQRNEWCNARQCVDRQACRCKYLHREEHWILDSNLRNSWSQTRQARTSEAGCWHTSSSSFQLWLLGTIQSGVQGCMGI